MNWSELIWFALGALLLVCLGMLLGATWTTQAIQPRLRVQAEERRRLNQEWVAVRAAQRQLVECPRCGYPLAKGSYPTSTRTDAPLDDD